MSPVNPTDLAERAKQLTAERQRARTDKFFLANEVLGYTFVEDVHTELFDQLLQMDASKSPLFLDETKDRLILWPRGHFKSTAMTVEVIQLILNYPDIRICIMRSTLKLSQDWLSEIVSHFNGSAPGSRLGELFPEFCGNKQQLKLRVDKFTVPARKQQQLRQPTVFVASFTSDTTGTHYDVLFADDLVTKDNYQKPDRLQKVIDGFWAIAPQVDPGGYRFVIGTRYAHGDLYDDITRKNINGNWTVSVKDCWGDDGESVRFPQRVVTLRSGVTKPIGFTRELLAQLAQDDPVMFCCQYLNRPAIEATSHFNDAMFTTAKVDPETPVALLQPVLFIDLASTTGQKSDDSVILCGKTDGKGTIYLVDGIGDRWEPQTLAMNIIAMTVKHRPLKVMFEKTASCIYFVETLKMLATEKGVHIPVDYIKVDNKPDAKTIRVKNVSTYLTRGRLKIFSNLPCWDKLVRQFLRFTGERHSHDDYPDTTALMVNFFAGNVQPQAQTYSPNRMMDFLLRDAAADQMRMMQQEPDWNRYAGTMGDDFAC